MKQSEILPLFILCGILLFASCNTTPQDKVSVHSTQVDGTLTPTIPEKEKITTAIVQSDTTQSYTLFVPTTIANDTMILVFFDPGAKGEKPVELYKALAEKHGIILVGSNSSKNGLSGEQSGAIAKKLVQDVKTRFSVGSKHIYSSGFSGGARVAVLTAVGENLPGVIGCGAGFPGKVDKNYGFKYVGMVGNEDFNFLEMKRLYNELERVNMKHQLIVFDGDHAWAPAAEMERAILLMKGDAQSKEALRSQVNANMAVYEKEKDWVRLYDEYRFAITSGQDSTYIKQWRKQMGTLKKNEACLSELKKEAEIETKEDDAQKSLAQAFAGKDFTFITNQVKALQSASKKDKLQAKSDKRLLQFVSLMGFLYSEKALGRDVALAKKYLDIYGKADADNPDYHFLMACYHVKANDKTAAMTSLKKAVELGLDDEDKIRKNTYLTPLQNEAGFAELLKPSF